LDTLLGSDPSIEGLGEVDKVPLTPADGGECACGAIGMQCGFWTAVRDRWAEGEGPPDPDYAELQRAVEPMGRLSLLTRSWAPADNDETARFLRQTASLYRAASEVSGRSVMVDSTGTPGRLAALIKAPGLEVSAVHLIRDPRGTAVSFAKQLRKAGAPNEGLSAHMSALHWRRRNAESELVLAQLSPRRRIRIRYEDLVEDPVVELDRIGALLDLDLTATGRAAASRQPWEPRHTVAGNRLRLGGQVRMQEASDWSDRLNGRQRGAVELIDGPAMRRYGYGKRGAAVSANG
jgi:hypothetical protein